MNSPWYLHSASPQPREPSPATTQQRKGFLEAARSTFGRTHTTQLRSRQLCLVSYAQTGLLDPACGVVSCNHLLSNVLAAAASSGQHLPCGPVTWAVLRRRGRGHARAVTHCRGAALKRHQVQAEGAGADAASAAGLQPHGPSGHSDPGTSGLNITEEAGDSGELAEEEGTEHQQQAGPSPVIAQPQKSLRKVVSGRLGCALSLLRQQLSVGVVSQQQFEERRQAIKRRADKALSAALAVEASGGHHQAARAALDAAWGSEEPGGKQRGMMSLQRVVGGRLGHQLSLLRDKLRVGALDQGQYEVLCQETRDRAKRAVQVALEVQAGGGSQQQVLSALDKAMQSPAPGVPRAVNHLRQSLRKVVSGRLGKALSESMQQRDIGLITQEQCDAHCQKARVAAEAALAAVSAAQREGRGDAEVEAAMEAAWVAALPPTLAALHQARKKLAPASKLLKVAPKALGDAAAEAWDAAKTRRRDRNFKLTVRCKKGLISEAQAAEGLTDSHRIFEEEVGQLLQGTPPGELVLGTSALQHLWEWSLERLVLAAAGVQVEEGGDQAKPKRPRGRPSGSKGAPKDAGSGSAASSDPATAKPRMPRADGDVVQRRRRRKQDVPLTDEALANEGVVMSTRQRHVMQPSVEPVKKRPGRPKRSPDTAGEGGLAVGKDAEAAGGKRVVGRPQKRKALEQAQGGDQAAGGGRVGRGQGAGGGGGKAGARASTRGVAEGVDKRRQVGEAPGLQAPGMGLTADQAEARLQAVLGIIASMQHHLEYLQGQPVPAGQEEKYEQRLVQHRVAIEAAQEGIAAYLARRVPKHA